MVDDFPTVVQKPYGQCHHLEGKPGCRVELPGPLQFRAGRADCVPAQSSLPYAASKHEVHPVSTAGGRDTVQFFRQQFGLSGQETVALMGAHTLGRFMFSNSLFRYVWKSRGEQMFNNDYYKMITDKERWYFNDDACTKVFQVRCENCFWNTPVRLGMPSTGNPHGGGWPTTGATPRTAVRWPGSPRATSAPTAWRARATPAARPSRPASSAGRTATASTTARRSSSTPAARRSASSPVEKHDTELA